MSRARRKQIVAITVQEPLLHALELACEQYGVLLQTLADGQECLAHLDGRPSDLLIVDLSSRPSDGLALLSQAKQTHPWLPILAVVARGDTARAVQAMKLGATDCLAWPVDRARLESAIEEGLSRLDPAAYPTPQALTPAEIKVLRLVLSGRNSREIAQVLHLSDRTVTTHRRNLGRKLGVSNAIELVKWAIVAGLLTRDGRVR